MILNSNEMTLFSQFYSITLSKKQQQYLLKAIEILEVGIKKFCPTPHPLLIIHYAAPGESRKLMAIFGNRHCTPIFHVCHVAKLSK